MIGYVHIEELPKQLEFDFSEPAPPEEAKWTQPDLPFEENLWSGNPDIYEFPKESDGTIVYLPLHNMQGSSDYIITTTSDPLSELAITDRYKIQSDRLPNIWHRFWQKLFLGFTWKDLELK